MIIDNIKNKALYSGLSGGIRTALDYLAGKDFSTLAPGSQNQDRHRLGSQNQDRHRLTMSPTTWTVRGGSQWRRLMQVWR